MLLARHRCYLPELEPLLDSGTIHALAHVTGGGLTDNVPRVLPKGLGVRIDLGTLRPLPVFHYLMDKGRVAAAEMLRAFNMGVGMVVIANDDPGLADAWEIGEVVAGSEVTYEGSL